MRPGHLTFISDRFQPLGPEAAGAVLGGVARGGRTLLLVRDADRPRSMSDPLTLAERADMIEAAFPGLAAMGKLGIEGVPWRGSAGPARTAAAGSAVMRHVGRALADGMDPVIHLWGFCQEESDCIQRLAAACFVEAGEQSRPARIQLASMPSMSAPAAREWMEAFVPCDGLAREDRSGAEVLRLYGAGPHATADAVCLHRGRALLVERGDHPFKGLLALPGGIVDPGETPARAAVRELEEETGIGWAGPAEGLFGLEYGSPGRDPRGDYRTTAFLLAFPDDAPAPEPRAASDAARAEWVAVDSLAPHRVAFDHFEILHDLAGAAWPVPASRPEGAR